MTTVLDENVHSIAIDGTSDDADVPLRGVPFFPISSIAVLSMLP